MTKEQTIQRLKKWIRVPLSTSSIQVLNGHNLEYPYKIRNDTARQRAQEIYADLFEGIK